MVTPKGRPSRTGLRFIGMLRNAIERDASGGPATLTHHLAVPPPGGGPAHDLHGLPGR